MDSCLLLFLCGWSQIGNHNEPLIPASHLVCFLYYSVGGGAGSIAGNTVFRLRQVLKVDFHKPRAAKWPRGFLAREAGHVGSPRQTNFDGDYPSKNCFEDAKALANFLATKHWSAAFQSFLDAITMFDDSRLDTVTAITCLQEWSAILQKYQDSIPADAHLQLFLEGSRFMVPSVSEDCDLPDCSVPTSKRDAA